MLESVRNNLGQQNVGDGFRRGWGTMDRARNNLAGQNEGDGGGGGGVRWIVYATSSRKITRVMGQQGWVRWIGSATSSRDKTWGMSLVVSL